MEKNFKNLAFRQRIQNPYDYAVGRGLKAKGLMCIPQQTIKQRLFQKLFKIKESINKNLKLSMGRSSDYEIAVKEGSILLELAQ